MSGSRANTELQNQPTTLWEKVKKVIKGAEKSIPGDKGSTIDQIRKYKKKQEDTINNY